MYTPCHNTEVTPKSNPFRQPIKRNSTELPTSLLSI